MKVLSLNIHVDTEAPEGCQIYCLTLEEYTNNSPVNILHTNLTSWGGMSIVASPYIRPCKESLKKMTELYEALYCIKSLAMTQDGNDGLVTRYFHAINIAKLRGWRFAFHILEGTNRPVTYQVNYHDALTMLFRQGGKYLKDIKDIEALLD